MRESLEVRDVREVEEPEEVEIIAEKEVKEVKEEKEDQEITENLEIPEILEKIEITGITETAEIETTIATEKIALREETIIETIAQETKEDANVMKTVNTKTEEIEEIMTRLKPDMVMIEMREEKLTMVIILLFR